MTRDETSRAPLVPARAMQSAGAMTPPGRARTRAGGLAEALIWTARMVSALVTASRQEKGFGSHTCLAQAGKVAVTQPVASKTLPMWINHRLESRMRENRPYGSEGGEGESPSLPLSVVGWWFTSHRVTYFLTSP